MALIRVVHNQAVHGCALPPTSPSPMDGDQIAVEVQDLNDSSRGPRKLLSAVWCPQERLEGQIMIKGPLGLSVDEISISLRGLLEATRADP